MFNIIGWLLFGFGAVRLIVALVNLLSKPYLPPATNGKGKKISVLVPARNEERNLPRLFDGFGRWRSEVVELIIYDDMSTDATGAIASRMAAVDRKVKVIKGGDLPAGWLGKNHACDLLSGHATGDILLFIDADVRITPGAIASAAGYMEGHGLDLLSIFPTQIMDDPGTRLVVPLMNWILLSLLPLPAVRLAPYPSLAAANGQFMMFTKERYLSLRPHSRFRGNPVEDIAIIKHYKHEGLTAATLLGGREVFCRMYDGLKEAVNGFSRNIFDFFGHSPAVCWLFIIATTVAPFWIFFFCGRAAGIIYVIIIILLRMAVSAASRQDIFFNIVAAVPQQVVLWAIAINATVKMKKGKLQWKGRDISGK